ncbi:MAG TPA: hypothetical protein H9717_06850 [Candidatus Eisenbergiella merdipullorum]|uniref:Uncharacterized protein n=1 Tax=Candidatus Eisenbergiella merdipullorum TaxID=2838553 RepID=A0A9D2L100_9FIRM|nr:hypothetical protein [Candidatus Eisenbergiella merdipullorum]
MEKNTKLFQIAQFPITIVLYVINFTLSAIPALFYTAPAFEDGLGTMASAAYLAGYDWSAFLAADGYYYKYGQSLWYLLPFFLIPQAVLRYRVMLLINSVLTSFIPVLAWRIAAGKLHIEKRTAFFIAFLTGIYPSILLYGKYTWAETNLMVLPWVCLLLLFRIYGTEERHRIRDSVFLAAAVIYAYMSHQRGMVLILAVTLTLVCLQCAFRFKLHGAGKRGICWPSYLLTLGAGLLADSVLSGWLKAYVYAGAVMEHNTLRDFLQPELYRKLLSAEGLRVVLETAAGWLFHSGASTFGCAFLGLLFMIGVVWKWLRGREGQEEGYLILSLLGLFCYFGALALGLLFFFQDLYGYFDGSKVVRCDHLLFGRYLESSVPILLFVGLIVLYGKTVSPDRAGGKTAGGRLRFMALLLFAVVASVTVFRLLPLMDQVSCYVHSLMALNLFMDTGGVSGTLDVIPNYVEALAAFAGLSFLIFLFLLCARGRKGRRCGAVLLCVLFLWIYGWNCVTVIGHVDRCQDSRYAEVYLNGLTISD